MSNFNKLIDLMKGSPRNFSGKSTTPSIPGFYKERPVVIEADVENYRTFAYAQVSFVCGMSGQPWQLLSVAQRDTESQTLIELEFQIENPKSGRPPLVHSMFFDITACLERAEEDEESDDNSALGWFSNTDTPRVPVSTASFLNQDRKRRSRNGERSGFMSYR